MYVCASPPTLCRVIQNKLNFFFVAAVAYRAGWAFNVICYVSAYMCMCVCMQAQYFMAFSHA